MKIVAMKKLYMIFLRFYMVILFIYKSLDTGDRTIKTLYIDFNSVNYQQDKTKFFGTNVIYFCLTANCPDFDYLSIYKVSYQPESLSMLKKEYREKTF